MIDGMAIKQNVRYNGFADNVNGYVDMGGEAEDGHEVLAKEALVFMAVGLQGYWKAPVAYFFTRGLTAEVQKNITLHVIASLNNIGIQVEALTMDGLPTNLSMCRLLGCKFDVNMDPMVTSFCSPGSITNTHVFLDACHMLKLVRNTLGAYKILTSPDGQVQWRHIVNLQNLQEDSGLHAANKLTRRHIEFHQQKMKVSLAAGNIFF